MTAISTISSERIRSIVKIKDLHQLIDKTPDASPLQNFAHFIRGLIDLIIAAPEDRQALLRELHSPSPNDPLLRTMP